jgi:N utilization substance protein A
VFRTLIRKKYSTDENFDIIVNDDEGDLEIWRKREIVPNGEVEDDRFQITIDDALSIEPDYELGEECYEPVTIQDFGRRAIMAARQTLISRILELEKDKVFKMYEDKIGVLVRGEVHQILKREIVVLDDETGAELLLPKPEMIRGDYFRKGDTIRAIIRRVEMRNSTPAIILSRIDNNFLAKLLEQEVPEIEDGLITIKKIVRQPGERAKVAVESYDDRIDPVGACVGVKGSRIHGIVRELRNENIDVVNHTENMELLISRALSPAKIKSVSLDDAKMRAAVYMDADQVSLAIGRGGHNINLAGKLVGYEIDVYRDTDSIEDDVAIDEFSDVFEGWVIDALKGIGCDTAKSVLALSTKDLVLRTDLEKETIEEILKVLNAEFED